MTVEVLPPSRADDVLTVLCEAFHDYPVMRYVLGPRHGYDRRLRTLIRFFVSARALRHEPLLTVRDGAGVAAAAALVTLPGDRASPQKLDALREAVWSELGATERERYETFGGTSHQFIIEQPHYHLNMIGVRPSHVGQGLARKLLGTVHDLSCTDPLSCGVTLSTETPANLGFYEHFGYRLLGHARVDKELETWAFFRPNNPAG
jgi:GNAT superfamily N-acetyltransferase